MGRESRRKLEQRFRDLGGCVSPVRRTGEVRYSHPFVLRTFRCNNRRKDAPQVLVDLVRKVERADE